MTTRIFDAAQTARLTPYASLVDALKEAAADYAQGRIASPERLVVPLNAGGVMLSMPATAPDLAIHKLVNVCPANRTRGLPVAFTTPMSTWYGRNSRMRSSQVSGGSPIDTQTSV